MKVVVIGCGKLGLSLITALTHEGHEVVVIDPDRAAVEQAAASLDVLGFCANGTDHSVLRDAGMKNTDLFLAVTGSDELNMLSCFLARRMGAAHTAARIRDWEYDREDLHFLRSELELDLILNPERLTARAVFNRLRYPSSILCETFTRSSFEITGFAVREGSELDGAVLAELRGRHKHPFLICLVEREGVVTIPRGSFRLQAGDKIGLLAQPDDLRRLLRALDIPVRKSRETMLVGAGRISMYLAELLERDGNNVRIVDRDEDSCARMTQAVPNATVICADASRPELLDEEGIGYCDSFVALTGMDEENILLAAYAREKGPENVIVKINRPGYAAIGARLGLASQVSPAAITTDSVLSYVHALHASRDSQVETLYSLFDGAAEAVEFSVGEGFEGCRRALSELKLRRDILVAGILRGSQRIIPGGDDVLLPGDRVIVLSAGCRLRRLAEILQ